MAAAPRFVPQSQPPSSTNVFGAIRSESASCSISNSSRCTSIASCFYPPLSTIFVPLRSRRLPYGAPSISLRTCCEPPPLQLIPGYVHLCQPRLSCSRAKGYSHVRIQGRHPRIDLHVEAMAVVTVGNREDSKVKVKSSTCQTNRLPVFFDARPERFVIHIHVF
jgi:hypothetical protein